MGELESRDTLGMSFQADTFFDFADIPDFD
jgi:hypothetical protein